MGPKVDALGGFEHDLKSLTAFATEGIKLAEIGLNTSHNFIPSVAKAMEETELGNLAQDLGLKSLICGTVSSPAGISHRFLLSLSRAL